jgi:pyridoxamine 5'-phosphate oxidase
LSALASNQSQIIENRAVVEERVAALAEEYEGTAVPRPEQWGGYLLDAEEFEFWQGRPDRLHDRFQYRLVDGTWVVERLAP